VRLAPAQDSEGRTIQVIAADIEEVDITDPGSVAALIHETAPHVIINCAAYTDVDGCESNREKAFAVNGVGAGNLAAAARACGARFIHISTDFVFDGEKDEPYDEADAPRPINAYGESKLDGERRVQAAFATGGQAGGGSVGIPACAPGRGSAGIPACAPGRGSAGIPACAPAGDWVILRTAWLYGRHGRNFVDTILRLGAQKPQISVVADQVGCPTYAADLAETIWRVAQSRITGIFHAVNQGSCSRFEQAREIVRLAGLSAQVVATTSAAFPLPARRPACTILSTEKLVAATGHALRSWRAALAAYLAGR
jgi:dTDP-4-dehydrorhamnose reductase